MKNILSYITPVSGKEIKEWILYHLERQTSHTRDALKLKRYLNVKDTGMYKVYFRKKYVPFLWTKKDKEILFVKVDKQQLCEYKTKKEG